ncbi:hypothetical protein VA596_31880 [Amycolatopsis sp., V23-08]|uniref:Uncharacterized protein n=1 Tax=Amycolatopsis heterodermiae TaxID=3110235 RepID=A0ABU5RD34_9PSEU|nr:hypothetical protein [Amycolatopsis sp., V23-08]MEA5364171.1 hypothetical protein [Amycolatopsis sp., V23-08]
MVELGLPDFTTGFGRGETAGGDAQAFLVVRVRHHVHQKGTGRLLVEPVLDEQPESQALNRDVALGVGGRDDIPYSWPVGPVSHQGLRHRREHCGVVVGVVVGAVVHQEHLDGDLANVGFRVLFGAIEQHGRGARVEGTCTGQCLDRSQADDPFRVVFRDGTQ